MDLVFSTLGREPGEIALSLMESALEMIDSLDLSVEVAAHLDLAISRLRAALVQIDVDGVRLTELPGTENTSAWPLNPGR
jgi:hypothetical protein